MKISELISLLNYLNENYGDMDVCIPTEYYGDYYLLTPKKIHIDRDKHVYTENEDAEITREEVKILLSIG